jgi:hypothetical protein
VDHARDEPLEQLALAEDDHGLVLHALRHVVEALGGLAEPDERDQELGAPGEQRPADGERSGKRERSSRDVYED